jgi:hypothetical protein
MYMEKTWLCLKILSIFCVRCAIVMAQGASVRQYIGSPMSPSAKETSVRLFFGLIKNSRIESSAADL